MANSQINFNSIANYDPEKLQSMRSEEDILKQELSNSMREIEKMKRKVMLTGRANKSSHSSKCAITQEPGFAYTLLFWQSSLPSFWESGSRV